MSDFSQFPLHHKRVPPLGIHLEFSGIFWNFPDFSGISWNVPEFSRISRPFPAVPRRADARGRNSGNPPQSPALPGKNSIFFPQFPRKFTDQINQSLPWVCNSKNSPNSPFFPGKIGIWEMRGRGNLSLNAVLQSASERCLRTLIFSPKLPTY